MTMALVRKFRLGISAVFLVFLFLPLSQCSAVMEEAPPTEENAAIVAPPEPATSVSSATSDTSSDGDVFVPIEILTNQPDLEGLFGLVSFLFPLLTCLPQPKTFKLRLGLGLLQTAAASYFLYLVYLWVYGPLREPLLAGQVLVVLAALFWMLTFGALSVLVIRRIRLTREQAIDA